MPRVSVLMPCYNAAETLEEALGSLAAQTLEDFEVIAIDDGSADGTPAILQSWAVRDPRFRPIICPHRGIVAALNRGLAACTAPYIARMDADDRSLPQRLAQQVAFLEADPETAIVGCLVEGFPRPGLGEGLRLYIAWQNSLQTNEAIRREIFVESPLAHPSVLFRRACIEQVGGYLDFGWPEDYDLWLRLYLANMRFAKVPQVLLEWRDRPERMTRADSRYALEQFLRCKASYLVQGPLCGRNAVIIWGAGMTGRRLSKHLLRASAPLVAFIDVDQRKIGSTRRAVPILGPEELPNTWKRYEQPVLLVAVRARGARQLIQEHLITLELQEGRDWWAAA